MPFFNPNSEADILLLHADVRNSAELPQIASQVEWEIINRYTQRDMQGIATYENFFRYEFGTQPGTELKVRLAGYNQDSPENSDAGLKETLRRTIAGVVSYILRNYEQSEGVMAQSQGNRSIQYASGGSVTWRDFPKGWDYRLNNYDARIQSYGI